MHKFVIYSYLCRAKMRKKEVVRGALIVCLALLAACCGRSGGEGGALPAERRVHVDGMNREAFLCRYRDPQRSIGLSEAALQYMADSLPAYADGRTRAWNNLAFAHYQLSHTAEAHAAAARVLKNSAGRNAGVERMIAQLVEARLLQRDCRIADSYRLLYDIGRSGVTGRRHDDLLHNFAQSEYYITMLTLNFHYRNGKETDVRQLIAEVERHRDRLRVDYAQDMALNYAIAYGYQTAGESLSALDYCQRNYDILALDSTGFCPFHMANTLQMEAYALRSLPGVAPPDSVLGLYVEACDRFWDYGDPYQILGGVTSSARYALLTGDTLLAQGLLREWMDSARAWKPFAAPKMELALFDLLIRSRASQRPSDLRRWYEHHEELAAYIERNAQEDFALQTSLEEATRRSATLARFLATLIALVALLLLLTVAVWRSRLRLRHEKRQLEEAKRRDVERIANVETCLSVMRHDINPFIGYLGRADLPDDTRKEVTAQLLRTFDNIKSWTHLSVFAAQEAMDEAARQVIKPAEGVRLEVLPSEAVLLADRQLTVMLLRNLLNNALQHTMQGRVSVGAERRGDMVELTVADTGCGMTAEKAAALFRVDKPQGEHGFGLILCRHIVKRHDDNTRRGCKIWVDSQPGAGTTVHCLLAAGHTGPTT